MKKKHFSFPSLPATIELPMGNFTLDFAPGKKISPQRNLILHIILRGGSQRIWRKNF